jgi:hypothetical protein
MNDNIEMCPKCGKKPSDFYLNLPYKRSFCEHCGYKLDTLSELENAFDSWENKEGKI